MGALTEGLNHSVSELLLQLRTKNSLCHLLHGRSGLGEQAEREERWKLWERKHINPLRTCHNVMLTAELYVIL